MAIIAFAINLHASLALAQAALGLTWLIIIYLTTSQRWRHFS